MRYQITCDNCGKKFLIEAEGGQTVRCKCPQCHSVMQITLPDVDKGEQYNAANDEPTYNGQPLYNHDDQPQKKGSHTVVLTVIITIIVMIVLGLAFFGMRDFGNHPADTTAVAPEDTLQEEPQPIEETEQTPDTEVIEEVKQPEQEAPQEQETAPEEQQEENVQTPANNNQENEAPAKPDTTKAKR